MDRVNLHGVKIARVATISFFLVSQLKKQIEDLIDSGMDVTLISGQDEGMDVIRSSGYRHIPVSIPRNIKILNDLKALVKLVVVFRAEKYQIVHSTTPKAGLLCAIAGFFARVPIRIHTFTGQAWADKKGFKRRILKFCDKIMMWLNTETYADSYSQIEYLYEEKVVKSLNQIKVLGEGSLSGVDFERFNKDAYKDNAVKLRSQYGIPEDGKIILFLGRVTKDKGISELLEVFSNYSEDFPDAYLLIIGPYEYKTGDILDKALLRAIETKRVILQTYTNEPQLYLAMCDLLCIPSYREGFGTVVIEAAAMGKPTLGTNVQGLRDSVIDGVTGRLVASRNVDQLRAALVKMLSDDAYRNKLGRAAYQRASEKFDSNYISQLQIDVYRKLLDDKGKS